MKKILFVLLAAILIVSCQKKEVETTPALQEVSFHAIEIIPDQGLKSTDDWICKDNVATHAWVEILQGGVTKHYYPELFEVDDQLYTQAIRFPEGAGYCIQNFVLYEDVDGIEGIDPREDVVVYGTPLAGSHYADYVLWPLEQCFSVSAFNKVEIPLQVLCFQDAEYDYFGFNWFAITEIVIREQCFFGDFCVKHPDDYLGSDYENQSTGLQIDMPALFKIMGYKNDVLIPYWDTFNNRNDAHGWGVGFPVCVEYPDDLSVDGEIFTFELWIYVAVGSGFEYVHFYTWTFEDDEMIPTQNEGEDVDDGVVDFVLGNCNLSSTNLQLAPYQNLPTTVYMDIQHPGDPGYWNFNIISMAPVGTYDLLPGINVGWCADNGTTIGEGPRTFYVYSSLNPASWPTDRPPYLMDPVTPPAIPNHGKKINQVNWLFNHLGNWGMDIENLENSEGNDLQDAIWNILQDIGTPNEYALAAKKAEYETYMPLPGGWAAVLFFTNNGDGVYENQLLFTQVDP